MEKTKYAGIMEYENKDSSLSYTINYYNEFKNKVTKTVGNSKKDKMTLSKANKIRTNLLIEVKKRIELIKNSSIKRSEYEVGEMTLDECFERYYVEAKSNLKSFNSTKNQYYSQTSPVIGKIKIKDLDTNTKNKLYTEYKDKLKPVTIDHYLTTPKALINILKELDLYHKNNPFKYKKNTQPKQANYRRESTLSKKDINTLLEYIKIFQSHKKNYKEVLLFINIALTTGGRARTILNIKTEDLKFNGKLGTVILRESKTYMNVKAHLNPDIVEELKTFKNTNQSSNTKIFNISYEILQRFLKPVFDKLFNSKLDKEDINYSYKKIVIHTFRHTFATQLLKKNNLVLVQKLLGHKDIATTAKYITSSEKEQQTAVLDLINILNYETTLNDFA
jgi:integrase